MVDANQWMNENYPNNTRNQITELDVSNKNLEGGLNLATSEGFTTLRKVNASFNKLTEIIWDSVYLEELDFSHNLVFGSWITTDNTIKNFNFSHNNIAGYDLITPNLAYLDASNNFLTKLDLTNNKNLVELNCSGNPISNLSLNYVPNLKSFDCLGVKLVNSDISSLTTTSETTTFTSLISPSCSSLATETALVNNSQIVVALTTILGVSLLGWVALGSFFCYKRRRNNQNIIQVPGTGN